MTEDVFLAITTLAKDFKTNSRLLVCGFDKKGEPHIFSVSNPGKCDIHDLTGFYAIGIGAPTAVARLLILDSKKENALEVVLYQVFEAKVNAEVVQNVGYNWDAEILIPGNEAIPTCTRNESVCRNRN